MKQYRNLSFRSKKKDLKVLRDAFCGYERDTKAAWFSDLLTLLKKKLCIHRLGVKWDKVIKSRYVNGIPFVSNGYTKGVSFLSKDYIKWYSGVGPPGGASPYKINFTHSPLFNTRLINK